MPSRADCPAEAAVSGTAASARRGPRGKRLVSSTTSRWVSCRYTRIHTSLSSLTPFEEARARREEVTPAQSRPAPRAARAPGRWRRRGSAGARSRRRSAPACTATRRPPCCRPSPETGTAPTRDTGSPRPAVTVADSRARTRNARARCARPPGRCRRCRAPRRPRRPSTSTARRAATAAASARCARSHGCSSACGRPSSRIGKRPPCPGSGFHRGSTSSASTNHGWSR